MDEQKLGLTVFLLKPGQLPELQKAFSAQETSFALAPPLEGFFIPMPATQGVPGWLEPVRSLLLNPKSAPTLLGQSPSALLVITRGPKTFAVTFGHAWQMLEDEWLEQ